MQTRVLVLDEGKIKEIMQEADIPGVSIAYISGGELHTKGMSLQDNEQANNVMRDAVFGAASLSKPIFAYLVLTLIKSNLFHFNLDTKLVDLLPVDQFSKNTEYQLNEFNPSWMGNITVKMLLSHTSGLHFSDDNKIEFLFEPGTEYAYSNPGLFYLQKAIETHTKQPLEQLARTYVFDQIGMSEKSTFYRAYELKEMPDNLQDCAHAILYVKETETGLQYKVKGLDGEDKNNTIPWNVFPDDFPRNAVAIIQHSDQYLKLLLRHTAHAGHTSQPEAIAVFSLFTTAYDYALFIKAWMELKKTQDQLMALAFEPDISMNKDKWARDFGIPKTHLSHLASGLTWELETDDFGVPVRAYKTGDMDLWRAWAAIDFTEGNEAAIIYFSNSENGHLLANQIVFPNVPLEHAPSFFFTKWGFAKEPKSDWKVKENERIHEIIAYEHGYKLDVMPEDTSKLGHGIIYLITSVDGLSYSVFAPTSELVKSTIPWNQLPADFPKDISAIIRNSKQYLPTIFTHTQQAGHTRQPRSSVIAKDFYEVLKNISVKEPLVAVFFANYLSRNEKLSFETILNEYAKYFGELTDQADKEKLSHIFWEQIKFFGTPIIENDLQDDSKCHVYFLFQKDKIKDSLEEQKTKKHLYLQGDFHGYGATDGRQKLSELTDTGIMWHKDSMPRNAIVVYSYIQVEPSQVSIKPEPERSPFFNYDEGFTPCKTRDAKFPTVLKVTCSDDYSTHIFPYPGFDFGNGEKIFRVSADSKHAHISSERVVWPNLLSTETTPSHSRNFVYHATLYSDKEGNLHRRKEPVTNQYHDDLYYSDRSVSPYFDFTRDIQVFKPASGKIDDVIVVNDGIPYLIAGVMDHFEKVANENKQFRNTAFVFIHPLPGLKSTLSPETEAAYNKDPSVKLPGMGVRLVDYKHGMDQYSEFIVNKLFPELQNEIDIPDDPRHRVMIGSSMSGTASLYIALKRPDLFGAVIVQSPSPDNREKLSEIPKEMLTNRKTHIHLSCGAFEHPDYAAANDNVGYAAELSRKLGIPLHAVAHGHQFVPWTVELEQSLPLTLNMLRTQSLMQTGYIPGISIATISQGEIQSAVLGCADTQSKSMVNSDTQFWACSLSKPVFSYLVLKLTKDGSLPPNFLEEPLPWDEKQFGPQGDKKPFTPRMILSHQTGLPNEKPVNFKFNPGEGFRYSGEGYLYLQEMIEKETKMNLEDLAQAKLFGPEALNMTRTTFLFPEEKNKANTHDETMVSNPIPKQPANNNNAAGSLHTTATDYARFLMACMNDKDFIDLITTQIISMEKDIEAKEKKINSETLKPINWGLGFGLQKNEDGKVIAAFHWGHGPGTRTFFAINLEHPRSAVVYLTNSENGLAIAKDIVASTVGDVTPIMKFLSDKYGYEDIHSPNWKEYHEHLITGVKEETKGNFYLAIESYKEAAKIRPENSQLQYRILHAETENIQKNNQSSINIKMLKKLSGEYGPLKISIVGSNIQINDGGPSGPRDLKRINDNIYLDGPVILKFDRDECHNPIFLICRFPNGANASFPASSNKSELSISSKSIFSQPHKQKADFENKKYRDKKMARDDTAFQSTKEKKASQEFYPTTEKKRITSTDDFNITYGKRPRK